MDKRRPIASLHILELYRVESTAFAHTALHFVSSRHRPDPRETNASIRWRHQNSLKFNICSYHSLAFGVLKQRLWASRVITPSVDDIALDANKAPNVGDRRQSCKREQPG